MFKWHAADASDPTSPFRTSLCSASGGSRHPARLLWKRWRSPDEEHQLVRGQTTKRLQDFYFFLYFPAWNLKGGHKGEGRAGAFIAVHSRSTVEVFTENPPPPPPSQPLHGTSTTRLWQRQQLSDTSFHYGPDRLPPPRLHLRWGQINCKLPGRANQDTGTRAGMTA